MPRPPQTTLTPLELQIMQVLWERGPSTVTEVQARLAGEPAYTSVQTMLNVLLRKGKARREAEGRAYRYRAAVSRERAAGSTLRDLVRRMFGGDPEALLLAMVDTRQITREELTRVAARLAESGEEAEEERPSRAVGGSGERSKQTSKSSASRPRTGQRGDRS